MYLNLRAHSSPVSTQDYTTSPWDLSGCRLLHQRLAGLAIGEQPGLLGRLCPLAADKVYDAMIPEAKAENETRCLINGRKWICAPVVIGNVY
jgi:hypothetical protein